MNVLLVLVVAFAGLAGVVGQTRRRAAIRAQIHAAPSTFEDNALVTFTGTVKQLGEPLIAPLSGKPCVAYCAVARTYIYKMFGPRRRAVIEYEVADATMMPFVLVTKTGEVYVDGETCRFVEPGAPIIPRKLDREQAFLARHSLYTRAANAGFDEVRIEIGAKITVHGVARSALAAGGETGFREAPTQIRLSGDDAHPLTIDRA